MSAMHRHGVWDKLGIAASFACLVHCLAMPVLIPLLPMLLVVPHTDIHSLLLVPVILLTGLGIVPGYLHHRARWVLFTALAGVALCSIAILAEALFHVHDLDMPLTVSGGVLLISAHIGNLRLRRSVRCDDTCAA